jgi:hypothetical protein
VTPNSDAFPRLEVAAGRATPAERRQFAREGWPALAEAVMRAGAERDPVYPDHPRAGPVAGASLVRANLLATSGAAGARRTALARMRRDVPADLLAPPDPTIGELWPVPGAPAP